MTRVFLLYLVVVAAPSLGYAGFVWWRAWRRDRREERKWEQRSAPTDVPPAGGQDEPHAFAATELGYSIEEPFASHLLQRIMVQRASLLEAREEHDAPRPDELEGT